VHHYHIRCLRCGRIEDAPLEPIAAIGELLHGQSDYEILGHNLEFIGLCPSCRSQNLGEKPKKEVASRWS
jgi:Fur family ferric uptake transcriptional regulator